MSTQWFNTSWYIGGGSGTPAQNEAAAIRGKDTINALGIVDLQAEHTPGDQFAYITFFQNPNHKVRMFGVAATNRAAYFYVRNLANNSDIFTAIALTGIGSAADSCNLMIHYSPTAIIIKTVFHTFTGAIAAIKDPITGKIYIGAIAGNYVSEDNDSLLTLVAPNYGCITEDTKYVLIPAKLKTGANQMLNAQIPVYGVHNTFADDKTFLTLANGTKAVFWSNMLFI